MKLGRRKLYLRSGVEGDPSLSGRGGEVNGGGGGGGNGGEGGVSRAQQQSQQQMDKLERLLRQFESSSDAQPVSWLDKLAFRRIHKMQQTVESEALCSPMTSSSSGVLNGSAPSHTVALTIEFPAFKYPIVYHQRVSELPLPAIQSEQHPLHEGAGSTRRIFVLHDPEMNKSNPIEAAYHRMARSSKGLSRDLKPSKRERDEIAAIISSPNKRLSEEAKVLLWRFRFSLTDDQRAVTKFLRCVSWEDVAESREALELLNEWGPIPTADALELLSAAFAHEGVREYAVRQLQKADREEISNYLLQLVQALRYEAAVPNSLSESEIYYTHTTHARNARTRAHRTSSACMKGGTAGKIAHTHMCLTLLFLFFSCVSCFPLSVSFCFFFFVLFFFSLQFPDHAHL